MSALEPLKPFGISLARKAGIFALFWIVLYFCTQWMNEGAAMLFTPMVGALAGLILGWTLAENAVEKAGFSGMALWVILIGVGWLAIWIPELLVGVVTGWGIGGFGRWMLVMSAMLLALASAVWRASADH